MRKNKAAYICLVIAIAAMLIYFGNTYLLWIFLSLIGLVIATVLMIRTDAKKIHTQIRTRGGGQEGKDYTLIVSIDEIKKLKVCGYLLMELEIHNQMFQNTKHRRYLIPLSDTISEYEIKMNARYCGEVKFRCSGIWAVDYFHLFHIPTKKFEEVSTIIYPRNVDVQVELSRKAIGATREDINMQSREGNDPSEMYDVREYIPGDDIRSVHWKLSSKMDQLLLRQSSDPTHYHVVLLPDFGIGDLKINEMKDPNNKKYVDQINSAIAIGTEIGRQLIHKREGFCIAIPMEGGLQVLEVQNESQLKKAIASWLCTPIPKQEGTALRYFSMQHLEQYFSRLVILSAGEYEHNPNGLEKRIGITIISCVNGSEVRHDHVQKFNGITEILADLEKEKIYRIIC